MGLCILEIVWLHLFDNNSKKVISTTSLKATFITR